MIIINIAMANDANKAKIESKQISESDNMTSDELLELKKELAEEIVDKLLQKDSSLFWFLLKKPMLTNYLVEDGSLGDMLFDELFGSLWEEIWLISKTLKDCRGLLNEIHRKSDFENIKTKIFNKIDWVKQTPSESQESTNSPTPTGQSASSNTTDKAWEHNNEPEKSDNKPTEKSSSKPAEESKNSHKTNTTKTDKSDKNEDLSTNEKSKESQGESHEIDHFNITVSTEKKNIWENLKWKEKPALEPFACGLKVYESLKSSWKVKNTKYLTVVDFSKKRWTNRFFVINMDTNTVEYATKVGHGKWSGWTIATKFSNTPNTNQSSLWWYITPDEIRKSSTKPWSWLKMKWQENGINNNASDRWIYMHPWTEAWSLWCFTLPKSIAHEIMNKLKWWSVLFAFARTKDYFKKSDYFQPDSNGNINV